MLLIICIILIKKGGELSLELNIPILGINTEHTTDFIVNRKDGSGKWLFMCFSSPFEILTQEGIQQGGYGDCVIHDPSFPQYHCSIKNADTGFVNSWFHCFGSSVNKTVNKYELPLNKIIKTGKQSFFIRLLSEIEEEKQKKLPHYHENIRLCFEKLLLSISRENNMYMTRSQSVSKYSDEMETIRKCIINEYKTDWSIEKLSKIANLSPPRFAVLYKKAFGISPVCDLINVRIKEAQIKLLSTNNSIEQIAYECGFSSLYYFSRIFKQRTGTSPSSFRN